VLGGALEARRGRGEHTAKGARRMSGKGWRSSSRCAGLEQFPAAKAWMEDRWHFD
jgi:hypothetical protein